MAAGRLNKMCLAIPVKIKSYSKFKIEDGRVVDTSLVPDAKAGDWILCHADLAINKLPEKEAKDILKLASKCSHNADALAS